MRRERERARTIVRAQLLGTFFFLGKKKGKHGQKLHREDAQKDQFKRGNHTLKTYDNGKGRY